MKQLIVILFIIGQFFPQSLQEVLQAKLNQIYTEDSYPGISLGVATSNANFAVTAGYSDIEKKIAMKENDLLLLGSAGKTYFSAIAMSMVANKTLDLDAKISKYVGLESWFSLIQNNDDITIRMLMNHTSGISRYVFEKEFTDKVTSDLDKTWSIEERLMFLKDKDALFIAGTDFAYSDMNYIILGGIIEKITSKKIYDLVEEHILNRFNLNETKKTDTQQVDGLIPGYPGNQDPLGVTGKTVVNGKPIYNLNFEWTGGGYAVSPRDLAKWGKILYEWNVFPQELSGEFLTPAINSKEKMRREYGLGVFIFELPILPGEKVYGHSGFMPGYYTELIYIPKYKAAFALIMNSTQADHIRKFYQTLFAMIKTGIEEIEKS